MHTVIEANGDLAGLLDLWLEPYHRRGEAGIWIHSSWAGTGVSTTAGRLMQGYLFDVLEFERVSAPIATRNVHAANLLKSLGLSVKK